MKRQITITVLAFGLLAGCATRSHPPDWVSGPAAGYPAAQYLIGRGEAPGGEAARDRARADLAKIFEVNIIAESEDVQAFHAAAGEAGYEGRSTRRITTRTERLIEGVEIAETWHDPKTGNYHALAVLPRLQAGMALRQEIERLDEATRLQLDRARAAGDLLAQIAAASRAVVAQSERASYQQTLRIVDPAGVGEASAWRLERLRADLDGLLKRVKLAPRVAADARPELAPLVQGALAAAGFLADTGGTPDYVLEARLILVDLGQKDGWYWQRGVLQVELVESATQRLRGTKRWPINSAALARDAALQRALDAADGILKKELRSTLIGFAAGA